MNALYDLKEMLCKQLEDYGKKGELSAAVLERVDMLAHAVKNLDKIIETYEAENYSGDYMSRGNSYDDGMTNNSRARGRDSMGRYTSRYSRRGDLSSQLRDLMEDAPDDHSRQEIQRLITRLDNR